MQQHTYAISGICEQYGVAGAVICPGSRSAPLVFAFTQSSIPCVTVIDERSAGFVALGMAQQTGLPVALICTSGTALLNFYPAIAEAFYQKIQLLVISADRPPELLNQQDGQMIMQEQVYGHHVHKSIQIPCYDEGRENMNETAMMVMSALQAMKARKGPAHINVPLREPLYPTGTKIRALAASTKKAQQAAVSLTRNDYALLQKAWSTSERKLILAGQLNPDYAMQTALARIVKDTDAVILCDVLSNQPQSCTAPMFDSLLMAGAAITNRLKPDLVISFGGPVLSKSFKQWLSAQHPRFHFRIQPNGPEVNTYRNVTRHLTTDVIGSLNMLSEGVTPGGIAFRKDWQRQNAETMKMLDLFLERGEFSELPVINTVLRSLPPGINLQVANSSVVRYISYLGGANQAWRMNSNRGTSGIEGCVSTAVGAAAVNHRLTFLITGDLGFLYDRNALWNKLIKDNLRVIVINNQGGGIFTLIDGPPSFPEVLPFFTTPHQQNVKSTVLDNGLEYYFCDSYSGLHEGMKKLLKAGSKAAVLEVKVNMESNAGSFRDLKRLLKARISE